MLHARIVRFDVMGTVALFGKIFGTKHGQAWFSSQKFSPQTITSNLAAHALSIKYRRKKLIAQFG